MKRVTLFLAALLFSRVAFTQKVSRYVLENDLDLSGIANWIPIGEYESNYEFAQVGGIVGEFNSNYGTIGAAFGINTTKIVGCTYVGKPSFKNVPNHVFGEIAGAGVPETLTSPWGLSMNYKIENCTYKKK